MPEIASIIIAALTMWFVELTKRKGVDTFYSPVLAFLIAGLLSVLWFATFDPTVAWRTALQSGLLLGAVTGGLDSAGKKIREGKTETTTKTE